MINLIREENRQTVQQGNHFIGLLAFNAYPFGREEYENKWFEKEMKQLDRYDKYIYIYIQISQKGGVCE